MDIVRKILAKAQKGLYNPSSSLLLHEIFKILERLFNCLILLMGRAGDRTSDPLIKRSRIGFPILAYILLSIYI